MTDSTVLEILHAIQSDLGEKGAALAAIQAGLAEKGTALAALRADMDAVKVDLAEKGTTLAALRADMDAVKVDLNAVKVDLAEKGAALAGLRTDTDAIRIRIDGWPDLHFLQAAAQQQLREASEHRRDIEIKLDEIYGSMATSSEITKLRSEVAASIDRERELDLRVSAIELRLGIKNPLAPE